MTEPPMGFVVFRYGRDDFAAQNCISFLCLCLCARLMPRQVCLTSSRNRFTCEFLASKKIHGRMAVLAARRNGG